MVAPINIFRADSPPVAQITKILPANVVTGQPFSLGANGKQVTYTAQASTLADVVSGLLAALQLGGSTIPELTEFNPAIDSTNSFLQLTAATAGVPFQLTTPNTVNVSVTESAKGKFAINEVHVVTLLGTYTGGTFTIAQPVPGNGTQTTAAIAYNATAAQVQSALAALTGVGNGNVAVTGGPGPNASWYITWCGTLGGQSITPGTVNGSALTGNGGVQVTETQAGSGLSSCVQFLDFSGCFPAAGQTASYTLTLDGQTTSPITTFSAAAVQTALQALPNIGSGNVTVFEDVTLPGGSGTFSKVLAFGGGLAQQAVNQVAITNPISLNGTPVASTLQAGGTTTGNEFQLINLQGTGTNPPTPYFTLTFKGATTPAQSNFNTTAGSAAAAISTALQALSTIGANNVSVTADSTTGIFAQYFLVQFKGALANAAQPLMTVYDSYPGGEIPTVTRVLAGGAQKNEIQQIVILGTGGTFTLTLGAQTTAAIAWNASTGTLQTRIQTDLNSTVTACTVTGSGTPAAPWVVTVTTPANTKIALMTGNGASLTGGGGTDVEQTAGVAGATEVQTVTVVSGTGTFTLTFNGQTTAPIAVGASAGTVQSALTALSTVNTLGVTGSGGGPWTVTWSGAQANAPQSLLVPSGLITISTLTFSSGPQHFNDPLNWSLARLPNSGDALIFQEGSNSCAFGLNQMFTFTWVSGTTLQLGGSTWFDLQNGQTVYLTTTTTLPTGLAINTLYYIVGINRDAGTFGLATTLGGAAINVTGAGAGTHTIGVRLASFEESSRWTNGIGLPQVNGLGYIEYRPLYLHIGLATPAQGGSSCVQTNTIGTGQGIGSGLTQIDNDVDQVATTVITTGSGAQSGIPAVLWKGQNANNTMAVLSGSVGIGLFPNETAVLGATAPANALIQRGGSIELGPGVTITGNVNKTGGTLQSDGATINGACVLRG